MEKITLIEAIRQGLAYELERDPSVVVFGEDVGLNGGVFRATEGLQARFGKNRVFDTPLSEALIGGMAVGMAAMGLRPVAEIQFGGFAYPAFDQIINHASRMRNRTRGRMSCPMVVRIPAGSGIHAPEHHSENLEAFFSHVPGLRVVTPSSPKKAYGLLLAAMRDPDPVIFLEPTRLYRLFKEEVADDGAALPLDKCFVEKEGTDATIVSWGAMLHESLKAAEVLARKGISAEVIDAATVSPLDMETIFSSVNKTNRCVVVHEDARNCGVGAEITARLAEEDMLAVSVVRRVTGYDAVMPLARLEGVYIPSVEQIVEKVQSLI